MLLTYWHNLPLPTALPPPRASDSDSTSVVDQNGWPLPGAWLPDGDSLSKWIGPVADEQNDPAGTYTYETTFNLTGYNASTALLTGQYMSDNWLSEIILNGQVVADFPSNGGSEFAGWQALPAIGSDFVSGVNTLDFVTTNYTQATGNPTGFRVELQGTAEQVPVANNDSYSLAHDTTLSVPAAGVLANDSGFPLSAVMVANASHGSANLNSNGSFTYTPDAGYTGSDSFTYYATDGSLNSNTATVTLNITDNGTITTQPDSYSILHDQVLSVDSSTGVLANDSDSDGDSLTASLVSNSGPSHGSVQFNSDGSFTYTPTAGYTGSDSFQYTATDGVQTSAPTTVSIAVTDSGPTAIDHSYGIPENTTENVTAYAGLLAGASDADGDPLTASLVSGNGPSNGTVTINPDGSFTYTPNTNYVGSDSFQYQVSDGALTATATVTLTVHAADTAPTANADNYTVLHDQTLATTAAQGVLANDSDAENDPMTASVVNGPSDGTLTTVNGRFKTSH